MTNNNLTAIIYRGEYIKTTPDGWKDYDGTVEARMEIVWASQPEALIALAEDQLKSFATEHLEEQADWPTIILLCDGVPVEDLGEDYDEVYALEQQLDTYALAFLADLKVEAARKANDKRLEREREQRQKNESVERANYERLKNKFEPAGKAIPLPPGKQVYSV